MDAIWTGYLCMTFALACMLAVQAYSDKVAQSKAAGRPEVPQKSRGFSEQELQDEMRTFRRSLEK